MEFLRKYLLLLFLIANVTAEYILFMSVSKYLFYAALGLSVFFLLSKKVISPTAVKTSARVIHSIPSARPNAAAYRL